MTFPPKKKKKKYNRSGAFTGSRVLRSGCSHSHVQRHQAAGQRQHPGREDVGDSPLISIRQAAEAPETQPLLYRSAPLRQTKSLSTKVKQEDFGLARGSKSSSTGEVGRNIHRFFFFSPASSLPADPLLSRASRTAQRSTVKATHLGLGRDVHMEAERDGYPAASQTSPLSGDTARVQEELSVGVCTESPSLSLSLSSLLCRAPVSEGGADDGWGAESEEHSV